jgi:SpoVK/Ycf46/Vps4 family AAA+-type ATPase
MKQELTVQDIQLRIRHLPNRLPFLLAQDLALIYETEVKHINQAVKRNSDRFPKDFLFQLDNEEVKFLKSQSVTLHSPRANPYGFYREGANMLSTVLHTKIAIDRSIQIMRAFSALEVRQLETPLNFSQTMTAILQKLEESFIESQKTSSQILELTQDFRKMNERINVLENQMESVMKVRGSFNEKHWLFGTERKSYDENFTKRKNRVSSIFLEVKRRKKWSWNLKNI